MKPLPYGKPEQIVRVLEKPPGGGRNGISTMNYLDWQKDNTVFDYMAAQTGESPFAKRLQASGQLPP